MAGKILSILIIFITVGSAGLVYGSTKTTFQVANLSCSSCLADIASNLQQVEGALGMKADLRQGVIVIEHDDQLAAGRIAAAIGLHYHLSFFYFVTCFYEKFLGVSIDSRIS